ncbi:unnamed protein product [Ectocarpus sp. 12 AP-2014]
MNDAPQLRSAEDFVRKPEFHPRRQGQQSPRSRVANLLPETVTPRCDPELRRAWSLLFVAVVVALLTLGTMGRRAKGFDDLAVGVSSSGEELEDVGPDWAALSQSSTHGGPRTTHVQEVRWKFTSVDPSDSPDVASQHTATVSISPPAVFPKTHVSEVFRLVFVAGLEGTGHHYVLGTKAHLFDYNRDLPRRDDHPKDFLAYYAPRMMGGEAKRFTTTSHEAMENMRHLAEWAATLSSPGTLEFFQPSCSYPARRGPLKVMQYMDLRRVAETAEGQGIDFRVLYLRRSAKEMVIANTVHRKFHLDMGHVEGALSEEELFVEYMRVLFTDIAVLHSFLSEIGPNFITCHVWDRLGGKEQASRIANFISPNDEIAGLVQSSLLQTARNSSRAEAPPFEGVHPLVSRLQRKLDAFEPLYCG